ncbi:MAG: hypothetical protein N4A71_15240 [Carboxylicivirga sp.]|jgi:hypothetical protein|nr:hypothetical protein [Carboxylicivirga sp.]
MSDIYPLNEGTLGELSSRFAEDEHFTNIALPRLKLINAIRKKLVAYKNLEWNIKYSPTNRTENSVRISLFDERKKFHFFYVIPLSLGIQVHLYLGDNTFNFFEAYPLLLNNNVIKEEQFKVDATMNTLPNLVISKGKEKYERQLLEDADKDDEVRASRLYVTLEAAFKIFNDSLFRIINGTTKM